MKKFILVVILMLPSSNINSQTSSLQEQGSWFTFSNKIKLSKKIFIGHAMQMRRVDFVENNQVMLLKPSINYISNKSISVGLGYTYFDSFPNGENHAPIKKNERRLWQHVTHKTSLGKTTLNNRFIFEERFKDVIDETKDPNIVDGTSYAQRFRYRAVVSFNLLKLRNHKHILGKVSNELRIRFDKGLSQSEFDQNNFGTYLGYNILDKSKLWLGYGRDFSKVNKFLYVSYHLLHVAWTYDIDLTR